MSRKPRSLDPAAPSELTVWIVERVWNRLDVPALLVATAPDAVRELVAALDELPDGLARRRAYADFTKRFGGVWDRAKATVDLHRPPVIEPAPRPVETPATAPPEAEAETPAIDLAEAATPAIDGAAPEAPPVELRPFDVWFALKCWNRTDLAAGMHLLASRSFRRLADDLAAASEEDRESIFHAFTSQFPSWDAIRKAINEGGPPPGPLDCPPGFPVDVAELREALMYHRPRSKPRPAAGKAALAPLALRIGAVANAVSLSKRTLERLVSSGGFPPPDRRIGRIGLWKIETVERWLTGGAK